MDYAGLKAWGEAHGLIVSRRIRRDGEDWLVPCHFGVISIDGDKLIAVVSDSAIEQQTRLARAGFECVARLTSPSYRFEPDQLDLVAAVMCPVEKSPNGPTEIPHAAIVCTLALYNKALRPALFRPKW